MGRAQDIRDGLALSADGAATHRALEALAKAENRKAAALERIAAALEGTNSASYPQPDDLQAEGRPDLSVQDES